MVHYSFNTIKLAFDVLYKTTVILFLPAYLLSSLGLKDNWPDN